MEGEMEAMETHSIRRNGTSKCVVEDETGACVARRKTPINPEIEGIRKRKKKERGTRPKWKS